VRKIILSVCFFIVLFFTAYFVFLRSKAEKVSRLAWTPPELIACGHDNAYRCMSDEDYMQMIVFSQSVEYLLKNCWED